MAGSKYKERHLLAVYDLDESPTNYDVQTFCFIAEIVAREHGLDKVDYAVLGRTGLARASTEHDQWRIHNIVLPSISLFGMTASVHYVPDRRSFDIQSLIDAHPKVYPEGYSILDPKCGHIMSGIPAGLPEYPSIVTPIVAMNLARKYVAETFGNKPFVTITLREYEDQVYRNSNLAEWAKVAAHIRASGLGVLWVRDTGMIHKGDLQDTFSAVSANVYLRSGIYELAYLNLCVNNGVGLVLILNKNCSYLMFKMTNVGCKHSTSPEYYRSIGFPPGSQWHCATDRQRLVWEDDSSDVVIREIESFRRRFPLPGASFEEGL
jgi:hypothetical protein